MNARPYDIEITDYEKWRATGERVWLGHCFAFVPRDVDMRSGDHAARRDRLHLDAPQAGARVAALVDEPLILPGVVVRPHPARDVERVGCLVCDRDLYRAEHDTVHLFAAFPSAPHRARILVHCDGMPFAERDLDLRDGTGTQSLSMLLPGSYEARLVVDGEPGGEPARFTVAEYTLAPLTARLAAHALDRERGAVAVTLDVDSYQVPLGEPVAIALVSGADELSVEQVEPERPGRFSTTLEMSGDGPFRIRVWVSDDPSRIAEVALPGSRRAERDATLVNELGTEWRYSLMPEPGAIPLRGAQLVRGAENATPFTVAEVITAAPRIRVERDADAVVLVGFDPCTGERAVHDAGPVRAGSDVEVPWTGPASCVFVGAWVDGRPFEGFASFFAPPRLALDLDVPATAHPGQTLRIDVAARGVDGPVPALISVRDARLTVTDDPGHALAASVKRALAAVTAPVGDAGIDRLVDLEPDLGRAVFAAASDLFDPGMLGGGAPQRMMATGIEYLEIAESWSAGAPSDATGGDEDTTPPRGDFPESLFFGVVDLASPAAIEIDLADALTTYSVDVFALGGGDWTDATAAVVVDQPVRVDLDVPPAVMPGDRVRGRLRADTASGRALVTVHRDGQPLALRAPAGVLAGADGSWPAPVVLEFDVEPGRHRAEVVDPGSGGADAVEADVEVPGRLRRLVRRVLLLQAGESVDLDGLGALSMRVLPAIDEPLDALLEVTADYAHLCCEQTAAKVLAASLMFLTARNAQARQRAEEIVLAGIEREKHMITPKKGFRMYPDSDYHSDHYGRLAVRYLWKLAAVEGLPDLSPALRDAVEEGLRMADTAARHYGLERVPKRIESMEDAHAAALAGGDAAAVRAFIEAHVDLAATPPCPREPGHAVGDRALLAYAGASLIATGDLQGGARLANAVLGELDEHGGMYSTVDSVAAIALIAEIRRAGLGGAGSAAKLVVNGASLDAAGAAALGDAVESVRVESGLVLVDAVRMREEDWTAFADGFPVEAGLFSGGVDAASVTPGERVALSVKLTQGYRVGDLLHVSLPACLDHVAGGGRIKRFTVDFEGADALEVPLVVTAPVGGEQRFALCVRNMFEEERAASPALLSVRG